MAKQTISIKQFNKTVMDDYFRSYLFQVLIGEKEAELALAAGIGSMGGIFGSLWNAAAAMLAGEYLHCESVSATTTPVMVTSVQNVDYMHTQIKQAGRTTPQQWQITIRDDAKGKAFNYFNEWRQDIYPRISAGASNRSFFENSETTPSRYKRYAIIKMTLPQGDDLGQYRVYTLHGVWPYEMGGITLDHEQEGIATFVVTLAYDYFTTEGVGG
jgi:hypothetical protein